MKKNTRTLVILSAVLIICIGAYIGVTAYNTAQAQKKDAETKAAQIWSGDRGAPVSISYTNGDKTLSFVQEGSTWYVADNRDFPLQQDALTGLASALQGLSAVRTIDASSDLSTFGLDKPKYTLTAADAGGKGLTLLIGAENSGNYYAMAKGGDKIYTIAATLVGDFKPDYLSMITLDTVPSFSSTNVNTMTVTGSAGAITLDQHLNKNGTYTWFIVNGDTYTAADDAVLNVQSDKSAGKYIDDAVKSMSGVKFTSCAAFKPTAEALKTYGLDTPQLAVTVDYAITTGQGTFDQKTTKGTASLEIGAPLADGSGYYARLPGSNEINVLATSAVTPLTDVLKALGSAQ